MLDDETKTIQGIHYETGKNIEITINKGYIQKIKEISEEKSAIIAPGLVDIQVNGFMGTDFNKVALDQFQWEKVINHLSSVGVTTFFPTIITNSKQQLKMIFEENVKQLKSLGEISQFVEGFHLEGPYISSVDGPRGAHAKDYVRAPDWEEFCHLQEKADGMIKLVTISPEWPNSVYFIEKATENGVKVGIGHTAANTEQIRQAVNAGAILSTHLGNGAHVLLPRHPNYIWDQMAEEMLWSSVIADGFHLPTNVLKVINKVKKEQMILISDSVSLAGMEPGNYITSVGGEVTLTKQNRLHLRENPKLLAGSAQHLLHGVKHLVDSNIVSLQESIKKASIYPARLMALPQQKGLSVGAPADIMLFEKDVSEWQVIETYKNGKLVYQKGSA